MKHRTEKEKALSLDSSQVTCGVVSREEAYARTNESILTRPAMFLYKNVIFLRVNLI